MSIDKQTAERIKESVPIVDVLQWYGFDLKRSGKGYVTRCPFHEDRNPSLSIDPSKNICKCFSCGDKARDAVQFIRDYENKGYEEALRTLADIGNICITTEGGRTQRRQPKAYKPQPVPEKEPTYTDPAVMHASMRYEQNPLFAFMCTLFDAESVLQTFARYNVGTAKCVLNTNQQQRRSVVFWQVDEAGHVRGGKIVAYNEQTGKRIKKADSDTRGRDVSWVHAVTNTNGYNLKQCLFGRHLITPETTRIHVVESEKTALLASLRFGENSGVWVATGGKDVTKSRTLILEAAKLIGSTPVTLYPDEDGAEDWAHLCEELRSKGVNAKLARSAAYFEHGTKQDIGDWIVSEMQKRRAVESLPTEEPQVFQSEHFQVADNVPWEDAPRNAVQAYYSQMFPERRRESTYIPGTPGWALYPVTDHGEELPF